MISWHRFYDPSTGRYISADPIGLAGGMNLYAYVGGDPVNWVDFDGLLRAGRNKPNTGTHAIGTPAMQQSWNISGGAYAGGGADFELSNVECCKNSKKKMVTYITSCVGFGVGAGFKGIEPPASSTLTSIGINTSGNTCPKTGDKYLSKTAFVGVGVGVSKEIHYGDADSGASASVAIGGGAEVVPVKACAIIVISERDADGCCTQQ